MSTINDRYVIQYKTSDFSRWKDDRSFVDEKEAEWWLQYRRLARPGLLHKRWRAIVRMEKYNDE